MLAPTTAAEVCAAMAAAYSRCLTYRDIGTLTTHTFPDARPAYVQTKPFWTVFARPDRFRFEYRDRLLPTSTETPQVVWAHGTAIRERRNWGNGKTESRASTSLPDLLTALAGVSGRLSWMVPFLLLTDWSGGKPWALSSLTRLEDGAIGEEECYRLQGTLAKTPGHDQVCLEAVREAFGGDAKWDVSASPMTFWIEKRRLLLRRFQDSVRSESLRFRAEQVADSQPDVDIALSDEELAFGVISSSR